MLNCVTLIGRLVADPEIKQTQSGTSVTSFTVAVDRDFVKTGEERKTDFIDVVAQGGENTEPCVAAEIFTDTKTKR